MSRLPDANVADVCRRAGFSGDELRTAVASAFQSSGGIPGYDYALWPGPAAHYKGLWALDTVQWPDMGDRDLHNPHVAAHAARELTDACGGWSWCPAYRAGIHDAHYRAAEQVANVTPAPYAYSDPMLIGVHADRARRALDRLGPARDVLHTLTTTRG